MTQRISLLLFAVLLTLNVTWAQTSSGVQPTKDAYQLSSGITLDDLRHLIGFLASDSLKGRKPGTPEDIIAAGFIRDAMRNSGLTLTGNNGFQEFTVISDVYPGENNYLEFDGNRAEMLKDFLPLSFSSNSESEAGLVFTGYGYDLSLDSLKWNDYSGVDVKGKWVMVLRGDPEPENSNSLFIPYGPLRSKALTAKDKGAVGILFVTPSDIEKSDVLMQLQYDKTPSDAGIPVINITRALADKMLASMNYSIADLEASMKSDHSPVSLLLPVKLKARTDLEQKKVQAQNVVAVIPGVDPMLKDEYIVIGAHYDHLGWGGENSGSRVPEEHAVHNGADDNASGTAGVVELAGRLNSVAGSLKRSILFIAFAGEEMGLLGSREFIKNPLIDLKKITAMINMDMIGRLNAESKTISVGGTGTSTESDTIIATLAMNRPFKVNRSPEGYGPSDHAPFYSENIPVFYFTTGAHEDYHTPGDDATKIDYAGARDILNMIYDLTVNLSNRQEPLAFRESGSKQAVRYGRNMKVTLGIVPDMVSSDNKGLRVDGVKKGGPADQAGIRKGDVIVKLDGQPVTNIYEYMSRLSKLKPGQVSGVEVLRDGKKEVVIVQF